MPRSPLGSDWKGGSCLLPCIRVHPPLTSTAPVTISHHLFPHIMDLILLSPASWIPFRATCKEYYKRVEPLLHRHLVITDTDWDPRRVCGPDGQSCDDRDGLQRFLIHSPHGRLPSFQPQRFYGGPNAPRANDSSTDSICVDTLGGEVARAKRLLRQAHVVDVRGLLFADNWTSKALGTVDTARFFIDWGISYGRPISGRCRTLELHIAANRIVLVPLLNTSHCWTKTDWGHGVDSIEPVYEDYGLPSCTQKVVSLVIGFKDNNPCLTPLDVTSYQKSLIDMVFILTENPGHGLPVSSETVHINAYIVQSQSSRLPSPDSTEYWDGFQGEIYGVLAASHAQQR